MVYTPREIAKRHPTNYKTRRQLNKAHNQELRVILSEEGSRKYFMDNGMIIRGRTYTRILHLEEPKPLASLFRLILLHPLIHKLHLRFS